MTSQLTTSHHKRVTFHRIASHHMRAHHMTWHDTTSHHIKCDDVTPHQITRHDMTSRNEVHYLPSHHLTTHHIVSSLLPTNHLTSCHMTTRPDGMAEGWCAQNIRFGHRIGWSPRAHSSQVFLWFIFPPLKLPPLPWNSCILSYICKEGIVGK